MALGDNIPGIFADLPTSVMRVGMQTGGNPLAISQYVLDLFDGKDADTELSLAQEGMFDGPPRPTDGPLVDQLVLETGNPDMAIGMVIDNAMAPDMDAPDLDMMKADTAASYLANMTPMFNDIDPARIGQISGDLGITDDALASALQSLSTENMFADPAFMGTGEGVFNPLPQLPPTPVLPPPTAGPAGGEFDPSTSFPGTEVISPAMMAQDMPMPFGDDLSSLWGGIAGLPGVSQVGGAIAGIPGAIAGIPGAIGEFTGITPSEEALASENDFLVRNRANIFGMPFSQNMPTPLESEGPLLPRLAGAAGEFTGITPSEEALAGEDDFLVRSRANIFGMPFSQNIPAPTVQQTREAAISRPSAPMGPPPGGEPSPPIFRPTTDLPPGRRSPFDLELDRIQKASDQNMLLPSQVKSALEGLIVSGMDQEFQGNFERNEAMAVAHVNQAVQDVMLEWDTQGTADTLFEGTQALANLQAPTELSPPVFRPPADDPAYHPITFPAAGSPEAPGARWMPAPLGVPEAAATEFETLGTAGIYSESPGRAQWNAWLPSVLGNYGAPNVKKAYDTTFAPFYGTYLLSDEAQNVPVQAGFPDFMDKHQPHKFPVLAWSKRQGEWNRLVANSQAKVAGDTTTLNSTDRNVLGGEANMKQNLTMWQVVNGSDKALRKQYAISTALARYYKGRPVSGNYATRAVESSFTDIYDRIVTRTMTQGGDAFSIFIATLASQNPERFGVTGG